MKYTLRTKLSLSYVLVGLISVILMSTLANLFLDNHFREYVKQNQDKENKEIVELINQQYNGNGKWNIDMIQDIGANALENGLIIRVKQLNSKVIWDANVYNNGLCERIIEHMAQNMSSRYPHIKGNYTEIIYPLVYKDTKIGVVEIGSYGPYSLNNNDLMFINTLNNLLIGVGIFSLLFSLILGGFMASRLSSPISRVISSAKSIVKGYFKDRILEKSNTIEICELTSTINDLAETLEKHEALRKNMTADVAHELRTPLATLQSHIEAMIDGVWKPDKERLKSCYEEIVRVNKMVGDLERLAKYESANLILIKSEFDISQLIQRVICNFETDFKNKGIDIVFKGGSHQVIADKDKISQVFINLISNALKYTKSGGKVDIITESFEKNIKISVIDNGSGIHEEDLPFIFERFYRADKSRNRLTGGSGIGLSVVKAIIAAHKGSIDVKSKVDKGTEFILYLPKIIN